jgi:hypothetical protein
MPGVDWLDIHQGENRIGFVNDTNRQLAAHDRTEEAVGFRFFRHRPIGLPITSTLV